MNCYCIYTCLVASQIAGVNLRPFKLGDLVKAVTDMKDENTRVINTVSHMQCIATCIIRKACFFFISNYVPEDIFQKENHYKCILKMKGANVTDEEVSRTCKIQGDYIVTVPKALGGACSDHKCTADEHCQPLDEGGYTCKEERGRKRVKKKKEHN